MTTQVFKIVNDIDNDIFIGSTTQSSLSRLLGKYRTSMRNGTHKSKILEKMKSLGTEHFKIVLLEKYNDNKDNECKKKWINLLKPVLNQKYLDDNQRLETNLNYMKIWRLNNSEKIKQYTIDNKDKNKAKRTQQTKEWKLKNKDKIEEQKKERNRKKREERLNTNSNI